MTEASHRASRGGLPSPRSGLDLIGMGLPLLQMIGKKADRVQVAFAGLKADAPPGADPAPAAHKHRLAKQCLFDGKGIEAKAVFRRVHLLEIEIEVLVHGTILRVRRDRVQRLVGIGSPGSIHAADG